MKKSKVIIDLEAHFERELEHKENFLLKLTGTLGDIAKDIIKLNERVERLEEKVK